MIVISKATVEEPTCRTVIVSFSFTSNTTTAEDMNQDTAFNILDRDRNTSFHHH